MSTHPPYVQRFIDLWQSQQLEHIRNIGIARSLFESKCGSPPTLPGGFGKANPVPKSDKNFTMCKESIANSNIPTGTLVEHKNWSGSTVYPGICRNFDVYLPANTKTGEKLGLIFIPDGKAAWNYATKITNVLDNLIHYKKIPRVALILCGVGWEPNTGATPMKPKQLFPKSLPGFLQRWTELDVNSLSYGRMIIEEILPFVENEHNIKFSTSPSLKCIAGQSSAGMCAFNVGWNFPNEFGLIFGISTSFGNSITGSLYPREVRLSPKKNLKIALFVGEYDNDLDVGNWCEHTKLMESALNFKNYTNIVEVAKGGGHTLRYTSSRLADILEWLFNNEENCNKDYVLSSSL
jgi:enterochelin esterase-like enzyme